MWDGTDMKGKPMRPDTAPRYTSYPTAPHFHAGIDAGTVSSWISAIPEGDRLSLYIHVPYCDRLCWFCACHTKQTNRYDPVASFVKSLIAEIAIAGKLVGGRGEVAALHFGGGSPTLLSPEDLTAIMNTLRGEFRFSADAAISVEIDPNDITEEKLDALASIGLTRASLGIQDFDERVQKAINRDQSFEDTKAVVDGLRARGVAFTHDDVMRGWVIERLMCNFRFSASEAVEKFGVAARAVLAEAALVAQEDDPLLVRDGDFYIVPQMQRPLVRLAAARFDRYFSTGAARHSAAV